jgi:UDP-glucose 4-epimerase
MNKILVTGGVGFIGYHLIKKLINKYQITIIDNLQRGKMDNDFKTLLSNKNVTFINGDLTEKKLYDTLSNDFIYVYHLAAVIGVKNVMYNPHKVLYVNAISNLLLFNFLLKQKKLKKIFFSSTSEIYAGTLKHYGIDVPTNEEVNLTLDNIKEPRTTYMLSKMYGESICFSYYNKYKIPFTIGRYHNVYGPRMGYLHVIPEMFVKIKNSKKIDCFSPNHTRAMCYVDDAIQMTIESCESKNTNTEILNIGNQDEEIKIKDLVLLISKTMNKNIDLILKENTPGSPKRRCPDVTKIKKLLNLKAKIKLEEGLALTYNWYKNKLENVYE